MTTSSIIVKNRDNPVVINIAGIKDLSGNPVDLTFFTQIVARFKNDERNNLDDPQDVLVSPDKLTLFYGDTTESGRSFWRIWGINGDYPNGLDLTNKCFCNLGATEVCE